MLKNLFVLPDGTEIFSGQNSVNAILTSTITGSVNSGTELTLGSVCCAALEAKLFTPNGNLNIAVGSEITVYKVDDDGNRTQAGVFRMEAPERPSRNTYKFTAYDRISLLDIDLTEWVQSLTDWPYSLLTFAKMVCEECKLSLVNTEIPNGDFQVNEFSRTVTGRELMSWIGQIAARFCRATPEGDIEFAWYEDSGVTLKPGGERYYHSLKYEDYQVAKIEAVQVRLADSESGLPWPAMNAGTNCYVISGNPLITVVGDELKTRLATIKAEVGSTTYTPCKIVIPASPDIRPGHIVHIVDIDGNTYDTCVMTRTQRGQRDTLVSTGSARRDSTTAANNTQESAKDVADAAVKSMTQEEIFNKLTNNGAVQGLLIGPDGQIYINASYINSGVLNADLLKSGTLNADLIKAGVLQSEDGESFILDLINNTFSMKGTGQFMSSDGKSYITVEGDMFVLYAQEGEYGSFQPIARIGFSEDSDGYDYPYILMGNDEDEDSSRLGLVKQFANGIYIGNSAPRLSTGSFVGLKGAVGFFINTQEGRTYNVVDTALFDSFSAVFA